MAVSTFRVDSNVRQGAGGPFGEIVWQGNGGPGLNPVGLAALVVAFGSYYTAGTLAALVAATGTTGFQQKYGAAGGFMQVLAVDAAGQRAAIQTILSTPANCI